MNPSTIRRYIRDARETLSGWVTYRRLTGRWPWFSIALHSLNWVLVFAGMIVLIWCGGKFRWSQLRFVGILLLVAIPYGILWSWTKDKVKLTQIRRQRRLARAK
jgi:hypothetical protein